MERGFKASEGIGRRSRLDIIADILDASNSRVKKTHLMYKCSMSFTQMKRYLDVILKANLLEIENDGLNTLFRISRKGRSFLESYERLKALIE